MAISPHAALRDRVRVLASKLASRLGRWFADESLRVEPGAIVDATPEALPTSATVIVHRARWIDPPIESFSLVWVLPPSLTAAVIERSKRGDADAATLEVFAEDLAENLDDLNAHEPFTHELTTTAKAQDVRAEVEQIMQGRPVLWTSFVLGANREPLWLAWPAPAVDRLAGQLPSARGSRPEPAAEPVILQARSTRGEPSNLRGVKRLLKIRLPLMVTLANRDLPMSRLLDLGPGAIIEFEQRCDQPLVLMANSLPIAKGEAVKIGEHFGLKITSIVSPAERLAGLGGPGRF